MKILFKIFTLLISYNPDATAFFLNKFTPFIIITFLLTLLSSIIFYCMGFSKDRFAIFCTFKVWVRFLLFNISIIGSFTFFNAMSSMTKGNVSYPFVPFLLALNTIIISAFLFFILSFLFKKIFTIQTKNIPF